MYINEINIEELKAIYKSDTNAKIVLEYFTTRKDENVVTVDDLQCLFQNKLSNITRQDIISLFKNLEGLGVGEFKIGRRTQKTRFVSKISLVSVGEAVVDIKKIDEGNRVNQKIEQPQSKLEEFGEISQGNENNQRFGTKETTTVNKDEIGIFYYSFPLRPDFKVDLRLPSDLNNAEAERLTSFIKTLPYNTVQTL